MYKLNKLGIIQATIMDSSLDVRFQVGLRNGLRLGLSIQIAASAIAVTVATIFTTSIHFAVDKLCETDDQVLVLARSKLEVENALDVDRFYEHLHEWAKQCRHAISRPCGRKRKEKGTYVDPNFALALIDIIYNGLRSEVSSLKRGRKGPWSHTSKGAPFSKSRRV